MSKTLNKWHHRWYQEGGKYEGTFSSCRKRDWDAKNMMVKKNVRNWAVINSTLRGILRYYQDARDALEASGMPYTASTVIHYNETKEQVKNSSSLMDVEMRYETENAISHQTAQNRKGVIKMVEKYFGREDVDIEEADITAAADVLV